MLAKVEGNAPPLPPVSAMRKSPARHPKACLRPRILHACSHASVIPPAYRLPRSPRRRRPLARRLRRPAHPLRRHCPVPPHNSRYFRRTRLDARRPTESARRRGCHPRWLRHHRPPPRRALQSQAPPAHRLVSAAQTSSTAKKKHQSHTIRLHRSLAEWPRSVKLGSPYRLILDWVTSESSPLTSLTPLKDDPKRPSEGERWCKKL